MTIDEAISYLKEEQMECLPDEEPQWRAALGLGIEALKREKMIRGKKSTTLTYPLPGETKE